MFLFSAVLLAGMQTAPADAVTLAIETNGQCVAIVSGSEVQPENLGARLAGQRATTLKIFEDVPVACETVAMR